jgi:hypothetical protein
MPRPKTINTTNDSAENGERNRRPLDWYASRLDDAETMAYGRQAQYRKVRAAYDEIVRPFPERAKLAALLDRLMPAYAKMVAANDAESAARTQFETRLAELKAEAAESANDAPAESGQVTVEPAENGAVVA